MRPISQSIKATTKVITARLLPAPERAGCLVFQGRFSDFLIHTKHLRHPGYDCQSMIDDLESAAMENRITISSPSGLHRRMA
jgi:hypothetical protein